MSINLVLNLVSALVIAVFGLAGLLVPGVMAQIFQFTFPAARGRAEFRINLGGTYLAFGLAVIALLLTQPPAMEAKIMLGALWAGAAIARVISLIVDRPPLTAQYLGLLGSEIVFAVLSVI